MKTSSQALRHRAAAWLAAALACAAIAHAAERKPNFLFVYTDDQRWDAMGVVQREQGERARFPWFKSPNMDRLAAEGVRFRNAFVTLSLCAPSRAAFLTGRYNHLNGITNNGTPFPDECRHPRHAAARRRLPDRLHRQVAHGRPARPAPGLRLLRQLHRPRALSGLPVRNQRRLHAHHRAGSTTSAPTSPSSG